jgi:UDP-N-acetylmuramate--alanine ligase
MKHKVKNIHFVGIGGAGMSGIAEVLANLGFVGQRFGSRRQCDDPPPGRAGVRTKSGTPAEMSAKPTPSSSRRRSRPTTPEVIAARERKVPVVPRAQMLAELMR